MQGSAEQRMRMANYRSVCRIARTCIQQTFETASASVEK